MSHLYVGRVKTQGQSMARSITDVGPFKIFMDEPEGLGGQNGAPSPLDFILAAHAGCLNYMTFFIAKQMGIDVQGTDISVEAALDPGKFAGTNRTVRAGYQSINISIRVTTTASPDQLARLLAEVEARCPVSDNISRPTPVHISMTKA